MPSNRWSRLDSDEERLPAGMKRVGYDADDGRYTFQDQEGLWLGEPGAEFGGRLTYAGPAPPMPEYEEPVMRQRSAWGPLAPFLVIICVVLLSVWKFLPYAAGDTQPEPSCATNETPLRVRKGDTCWDITQNAEITYNNLLQHNPKLNCDRLQPGQTLCLPVANSHDG